MLARTLTSAAATMTMIVLMSSCNLRSGGLKSWGANGSDTQGGAQGNGIITGSAEVYCKDKKPTCPPPPTNVPSNVPSTVPGKPTDPSKPVDPSTGKPTGPGNAQVANPTPTSGTGKPNNCQEASAAFISLVQPSIGGTCIGCHDKEKIAGAVLSATNPDANRLVLWVYSGGSAQTLFNKISQSSKSHGGGNRSADLPLQNIEAWIQKEALCKSNP